MLKVEENIKYSGMCFEFGDRLSRSQNCRICDNHQIVSNTVVNKDSSGRILSKNSSRP
ncbi:hypothetical protein X777_04949 [Ooceraea biroi]|uniref:Uncharacterized protein n=1 Tax=Ooceraea biroi TaxID=2015173 RepID=A0A026WHV3_OOCBI|nr:hypothetical protein X777_04949 [Ooceraea biroi]